MVSGVEVVNFDEGGAGGVGYARGHDGVAAGWQGVPPRSLLVAMAKSDPEGKTENCGSASWPPTSSWARPGPMARMRTIFGTGPLSTKLGVRLPQGRKPATGGDFYLVRRKVGFPGNEPKR